MSATSMEKTREKNLPEFGRFRRSMHAAYFFGSGIQHYLYRRIRPNAIALLSAMTATALIGVGCQRGAIYQAFSFCLALILLGIVLAAVRRSRLEAVRETPRHATVGVPLRYAVKITNTGKSPISNAWLLDTPPDNRPSIFDFFLLKEPGEHERNRFDQTFAYYRWRWLMLRNRLFTTGMSHESIHLAPHGHTRIFITITPSRRGVICLRDLRAALADPCGLFQQLVRVAAPPATMLVLPKRYPLPQITLPGSAAFKISGDTTGNAIGTSGEFVGLREYRPGDPLRLIHWKSWARTGTPIVKELEDTFYPRYGLVLDTGSATGADDPFEDAVAVAASFASAIDTSDCLLDLMFIKNEAHIVTAGRGLERAEKLLEVLAGVTPEAHLDFAALATLVLRHREDLTSCIVILNGWDDERSEFLSSLTQGGILCTPIIIGRGEPPLGIPGHWLQSGDIAQSLKQLPMHLATHS